MRDDQHTTRQRGAFTVLELLVVTVVIGVLVGLLFPALMSARESARRLTCTSNMREIGLAIQQYHESAHRLPEAWSKASDGISAYGWAVPLLPFLEESDLRKSIDGTLPISAKQNDATRNTTPPIMLCPSDISEPSFELDAENEKHTSGEATRSDSSGATAAENPLIRLPSTNYLGVFGSLKADETFPAPAGDGAIVSDCVVRFADLQRGQSHTLVVGERTAAMAPSTWLGVDFRGEDAACRLVGSALTAPNCEVCDECEFASRHSGGSNFVWADGHVSLVLSDIDSAEYRRLAKRKMD